MDHWAVSVKVKDQGRPMGRIPGAHEAVFIAKVVERALDGKRDTQSRACDANPRPGMKHSFQFDHLLSP